MVDDEPIASGDASDFDTSDGEREHRKRERQSRRDLAAEFETVGERGWFDDEPPPPKPLVELPGGNPWLPREKVGMLAAPGGVGKSQALIQLALCVACESERKWLGHYSIPEESRGPVVLAVAEEGERDLWRRIRHITDAIDYTEAEIEAVQRNLYALPLAGQSAALLDDPGRLERELKRRAHREERKIRPGEFERATLGYTDQVDKWRRLLEAPPEADGARAWKAVMLDPASRFIGPEAEQDNAVATRFVEILEDWALERYGDQDAGPSVLFAHHVTKSAATDPKDLLFNQGAARGSSGLTDGVRWQANMAVSEYKERGEAFDVVGLNVVKTNAGPAGETAFLKRGQHGVLEYDPEGAGKFYDDGDGNTENGSDQDNGSTFLNHA